MEKITAIILGIIQGLTEFLPISSSGHVEIIRVLIDSNSIENNNLLFSTVIHGATALSTVIIFRNDIRKIIKPKTLINIRIYRSKKWLVHELKKTGGNVLYMQN